MHGLGFLKPVNQVNLYILFCFVFIFDNLKIKHLSCISLTFNVKKKKKDLFLCWSGGEEEEGIRI